MFWQSVLDGFKVFAHWETYAACLLFACLVTIPNILSAFTLKKGRAVGFLTILIIDSLVRAFPTLVFVFMMFPILLGFSDSAAWSFPWLFLYHEPWGMFIAVLLLVGADIVLRFVLLIGRISSVSALVLGGIALVICLSVLKNANPSLPLERVEYLPGFFQIVALIVISSIASSLGFMSTFIATWIVTAVTYHGRFGEPDNPVAQISTHLIAPIFDLIPVFIYGAWLGNQLRLLR